MVDYLSNALWTDDEIAFRVKVQEFCAKEIAPIADEIDKGPYPRKLQQNRKGWLHGCSS